jgi:hypothetical protein
LLSLRIPDLQSVNPGLLEAIVDAELRAAALPHGEQLQALDQAVFDLYSLERDEAVLAQESVKRARMFLFESRAEQQVFLRPPGVDALAAYANEVVHVVNAYFRARGQRHLEAVVYPQRIVGANPIQGTPGITAVRFALAPGFPPNEPAVRQGDNADIDRLTTLFQGQANSNVPPYLNERRQLRIYGESDLFILKPAESRYWTRTAGLNDGDTILADHWIKGRHVSIN